jgi:hypothetical protein
MRSDTLVRTFRPLTRASRNDAKSKLEKKAVVACFKYQSISEFMRRETYQEEFSHDSFPRIEPGTTKI